ncbi:MAG TPA: hypothetical protein VN653_02535 [Anaerolineales bacterium]|nr:hypothetical protein [Anaerolineales bacterium]
MNPFNLYELESIARQHQAEMEAELATQHLLKEAGKFNSEPKRTRRVVLRYFTVLTILSLFLLHILP